MSEPVRHVTPAEFAPGHPTPGMQREEAVSADGLWTGLVHTEPGMQSAWHHHGEYQTSLYIVSGAMRLEFGPGGSQSVDAQPGDFVFVPKWAIHREANPSAEPATAVITRAGHGEPVTNVDGPEPA